MYVKGTKNALIFDQESIVKKSSDIRQRCFSLSYLHFISSRCVFWGPLPWSSFAPGTGGLAVNIRDQNFGLCGAHIPVGPHTPKLLHLPRWPQMPLLSLGSCTAPNSIFYTSHRTTFKLDHSHVSLNQMCRFSKYFSFPPTFYKEKNWTSRVNERKNFYISSA